MKYISWVLRYKIQTVKKTTKTWPRCMEIRSNIGMDTILIKRAADMNCTWIRYSFEAAFTSTLVRDIVYETRCANYIFSDYDWYPHVHANYNVPPGYLQPWVCFDIFRLFLATSVQMHVDIFNHYFFFLVMKCVKIYPRVALQMQSNLYAHRTSFR